MLDLSPSQWASVCIDGVFGLGLALLARHGPRQTEARLWLCASLMGVASQLLMGRAGVNPVWSWVGVSLNFSEQALVWLGLRALLGLRWGLGLLGIAAGWLALALVAAGLPEVVVIAGTLTGVAVTGLALYDLVRHRQSLPALEWKLLGAAWVMETLLSVGFWAFPAWVQSLTVRGMEQPLRWALDLIEWILLLALISARTEVERSREQDRLRLSDQRFRDLTLAASDWFWEQDAQFRFTELSDTWSLRTGLAPSVALGHTWWELPLSGVNATQWEALRATMSMQQAFHDFVCEIRSDKGASSWFSISGHPLMDSKGQCLGYRGTGHEVTQQRRMEMHSQSERRILERLAQGAPLPEFLHELTLAYEALYPDTICSILLMDRDGRHLRHGAAPSLPLAYCQALDGAEIGPDAGSCGTAAFTGQTVVVTDIASDLVWRNYSQLALAHGLRACWSTPIRYAQGRVLGTFAIYHREPTRPAPDKLLAIERAAHLASLAIERDEAEKAHLSLEAQLRESQKMEAIGTLAGGIAHDFNNIVAAILGNVELARQDAAGNRQTMVSLDEIAKAGRRARNLTQQILSFGRRQPTTRRLTVLQPLIDESVRLLRATLPARVQIQVVCADDLPPVLADPTQIGQVLLNLSMNAVHAMQGRAGHIELRADALHLNDSSLSQSGLKAGGYARITVRDDGIGMDTATIQRIFEPFFTTKPLGEGTGLGLSVAHGIMRAHEGAIMVRSQVGHGSVFELYFPVATTGPAPEQEVAAVDSLPVFDSADQSILYLDDDEAIVFLVDRMLSRRGYQVTACTDAQDALAALKRPGASFDLVVSDYNMPGMSGLDFARAAHAIFPTLTVAITTGFISEELQAQASGAGVVDIIFKPDTVEELCAKIQHLLSLAESL